MKNTQEAIKQVKEQSIKDCEQMSQTMDGDVIEARLNELAQSPAALLEFQQTCLALAFVAKDIAGHREAAFSVTMMAAQLAAAYKIRSEL